MGCFFLGLLFDFSVVVIVVVVVVATFFNTTDNRKLTFSN